MKVGQLYPVYLRTSQGEWEVAQAQLLEIDGNDAYLEIPATRVQMGIRNSLGDLEIPEPEVERKFDGVQPVDEGGTSEAVDDVRALYEAEGIELDDTPDEISTARRIAPRAPTAASGGDGEVSLRDMDLDDRI